MKVFGNLRNLLLCFIELFLDEVENIDERDEIRCYLDLGDYELVDMFLDYY